MRLSRKTSTTSYTFNAIGKVVPVEKCHYDDLDACDEDGIFPRGRPFVLRRAPIEWMSVPSPHGGMSYDPYLDWILTGPDDQTFQEWEEQRLEDLSE